MSYDKRTKTTAVMTSTLSERLIKADPKAIEEIYQGPLGDNIRSYVKRKGGDQYIAEDVLTITIYRVINLLKEGKYKEQNRINGFIMVVAKNIYKEEKKRHRNNRKITTTDPSIIAQNGQLNYNGSLDSEMDQLFEKQYIAQLLQRLSERDRKVIRLYYLEGYKLVEIDKMLNLSKNHANVICARALKLFKKWLPQKK